MNTEIVGVVAMFALSVLLAIPLGKYIAKVYGGERTLLDPILNPIDKMLFKISGIDWKTEMDWKQNMVALLTINLVWFLMGMFLLMNQSWLPLNPDGNPDQRADLAFNTTISFVVNCNLQHYSGESGVSYLSQLFLMFLQFVSAETGMAAAALLFIALKERTSDKLGNFYNLFVKSCTRILLPLAIVVAIILAFNGIPMTFEGKDTMINMQGDTVQVSKVTRSGVCGHKAPGHQRRGILWYQFCAPFGKPQLPDQYGGNDRPIAHSAGDDFCVWFLPETEENELDDFRGNDVRVFTSGDTDDDLGNAGQPGHCQYGG